MDFDGERQLDLYDCLLLESGETCPDCDDPASCQAGGECLAHTETLLGSAYPQWDEV